MKTWPGVVMLSFGMVMTFASWDEMRVIAVELWPMPTNCWPVCTCD